jgi:hypothetical protein
MLKCKESLTPAKIKRLLDEIQRRTFDHCRAKRVPQSIHASSTSNFSPVTPLVYLLGVPLVIHHLLLSSKACFFTFQQ